MTARCEAMLDGARHPVTPAKWLLTYAALAAGMVAVGALGAAAIVALEERSNRRLGDGEDTTAAAGPADTEPDRGWGGGWPKP